MKLFIWIQVAITVLGSLIIAETHTPEGAASFAAGSGLILLNIFSLVFTWSRVIQKKLVALSLVIIVFKYAILGFIIYKLLGTQWLHQGFFCVGLGSLVVTTLIYGIAVAFLAPKHEDL